MGSQHNKESWPSTTSPENPPQIRAQVTRWIEFIANKGFKPNGPPVYICCECSERIEVRIRLLRSMQETLEGFYKNHVAHRKFTLRLGDEEWDLPGGDDQEMNFDKVEPVTVNTNNEIGSIPSPASKAPTESPKSQSDSQPAPELMREKSDEKHSEDGQTYGEITIQKAIQHSTKICTATPRDEQLNEKQPDSTKPSLLPVFPSDSIRGVAGRFADLYSSYVESPWAFLAMGFLTCLGAVVSRMVTLKSQIHPQPRLYCVFVGESSDDRKSEAIRQVINFFMQFLRAVGDSFFALDLCQGAGSAEGLAIKFRGSPLLLVYDELKSFVSKAQIEGSILLQCVCSLFDSNIFQSSTKNKSISLDNAHLSVLGASTVETYKRMWTPAFLDIGFINRLFVVTGSGERKFAIPKVIPDEEKMALCEDLKKILEAFKNLAGEGVYEMPIDDDALELFESWYLTQDQGKLSKRLDAYGLRLLIVLAISEGQDRITIEVVQRVMDLLEWQRDVRRILDPADGETLIGKIECLVKNALSSGPLKKRALEKTCHKERYGSYYWKVAIRGLIEDKEIVYFEKKHLYCLGNVDDEVS